MRTLKEQSLHPYHVQKVQALQLGDELRRLQFCRWFIQKEEAPDLLRYVLFTDEAGFTRDGVFNIIRTSGGTKTHMQYARAIIINKS